MRIYPKQNKTKKQKKQYPLESEGYMNQSLTYNVFVVYLLVLLKNVKWLKNVPVKECEMVNFIFILQCSCI